MHSIDNIFLVGMMGAGKTSVGRQLAKRLKLRFIDSDHEIESRMGVGIALIFDIEGQAGFRSREAKVLAALVEEKGIVLATGGGIVLEEENRFNLAKNGIVVYLSVPPEILWDRLRGDKQRPLLQVADPYLKLKELFVQRDPLYRAVADIIIDWEGGSSFHRVKRIEKELRKLQLVDQVAL